LQRARHLHCGLGVGERVGRVAAPKRHLGAPAQGRDQRRRLDLLRAQPIDDVGVVPSGGVEVAAREIDPRLHECAADARRVRCRQRLHRRFGLLQARLRVVDASERGEHRRAADERVRLAGDEAARARRRERALVARERVVPAAELLESERAVGEDPRRHDGAALPLGDLQHLLEQLEAAAIVAHREADDAAVEREAQRVEALRRAELAQPVERRLVGAIGFGVAAGEVLRERDVAEQGRPGARAGGPRIAQPLQPGLGVAQRGGGIGGVLRELRAHLQAACGDLRRDVARRAPAFEQLRAFFLLANERRGATEVAVESRLQRAVGDLLDDAARARQQLVLLFRQAQPRVVRSEDAKHLGLLGRPTGELCVDQRFAPLEHLLHRLGLSFGQRLAEHDADEIGDRCVAAEQDLRAVALRERLGALALRLDRLPRRADDAGDERREDDERGADAEAVAADELGAAVGERIGARRHRLVGEVAAQVVGECRGGRVALRGLLLQRLRADVLEVAPQRAAEPQRRLAASRCGSVAAVVFGDGLGERPRIGLDDRTQPIDRRCAGARRRMDAGEQYVEEDAERVDIGRGRHRGALDLLGRCVVGSERAAAGLRQLGRRFGRVFAAEQLGDAEVEQLHLPLGGHEDVARLEIAVEDEVAVGVRDRVEHVENEADAGADVEPALVAPAVDRHAVDMLEDEIRLAAFGDAGVEEARDVRMRESRERLALAREPRRAAAAEQREVEQLERDARVVAAVAAASEPDAAHAAGAERAFDGVGAERAAGERRLFGREGAAFEEVLGVERVFLREHLLDRSGEVRIRGAQRDEARRAAGGIELEQLVEERADALPVARRVLHGASVIERRRDVTPKRRRLSAGRRCGQAHDGGRGDERRRGLADGGAEGDRCGAADGDERRRESGDGVDEAGAGGGVGAHGRLAVVRGGLPSSSETALRTRHAVRLRPRRGARSSGTAAPCSSRAAPSARRRRASTRSRRSRSRRRTSARPARRAPARRRRARRALR
jgi:hypothetical protein